MCFNWKLSLSWMELGGCIQVHLGIKWSKLARFGINFTKNRLFETEKAEKKILTFDFNLIFLKNFLKIIFQKGIPRYTFCKISKKSFSQD